MANLRTNTSDEIEFQNLRPGLALDKLPYILAQLGDWEMGNAVESGIVIDAAGTNAYAPILSSADARKLAKWLTKAADILDGVQDKKHKKRTHYEQDDEPEYKF